MFATAALASMAMRAFAGVVAEARAAEQRFADMVAHAPDGILVLDASDSVLAANPAAEAILGSPESELVGQSLGAILALRAIRFEYHSIQLKTGPMGPL